MATLIKCPACETRYEVKAAFPPEGRKVRCSKCSHVWQAKPVGAEAPAAAPAPQKAAAPPSPPQPASQAPATQPAPAPQAAPQTPTPPAPPPLPQAAPAQPPAPEPAPPPPPQADAKFGGVDLAAQAAQKNAETEAAPPPEPPVAKQGGLFAKIMGKRASAKPPAPEAPAPEMAASEAASPPQAEANFTEAAQADATFDAGLPGDGQSDAALADPALVAAAFGNKTPKAPRKPLPIVALGWGILALIVLIVVSLFAFAPSTTVSMLPGTARIYSLLGMPVGASGLAFEGVRYGWTNDGSQTVLEVQGNVRNTSSVTMTVPTVIIALRDENGEEISEWTTEVGSAELNAGEEAPFLRQIPSPPSNVRSLKVRFADAN